MGIAGIFCFLGLRNRNHVANTKAKSEPQIFVVAMARAPFRLEAAQSATAAPTVVKDLLRCGNWNIQGKPWNVTPDTLLSVRENFARFKAAGNRVPLIWEHDGGAESRSGDLQDLFISGDTLYGKFAVTNQKYQASFGTVAGDETPHEVSVEVYESFTDGTGQTYAPCLTHVAIVLNPVVPGQGPFKRLSAKGKHQMAAADTTESVDTFGIDEVKKMLADAGFPIPDVATTKESVMAAFMAMVGPVDATEDTATGTDAEAMETTPVPAMNMSLRGRAVEYLRKQLSARIAAEAATAKAAFTTAVEALVSDNKIQPAMKDNLIAAGDASKWQLSILSPFQSLPNAVRTQSPTKGMQLSAASNNQETEAERKARIRQFAGAPATRS